LRSRIKKGSEIMYEDIIADLAKFLLAKKQLQFDLEFLKKKCVECEEKKAYSFRRCYECEVYKLQNEIVERIGNGY
jgi:hypothetical protein